MLKKEVRVGELMTLCAGHPLKSNHWKKNKLNREKEEHIEEKKEVSQVPLSSSTLSLLGLSSYDVVSCLLFPI